MRLFCVFFLSFCVVFATFAERTYKWIDKKGVVHYSDQLPSDSEGDKHSILNKRGVTIRHIDKDQQIEQKQELSEQQKQERDKSTQIRIDRILLDTYSSEEDLTDARDFRAKTLDGLIKTLEHQRKNLIRSRTKTATQIDEIQRSGGTAPENLMKKRGSLDEQLRSQEDYLRAKRIEKADMLKLFSRDLERYQELKALQKSENSK